MENEMKIVYIAHPISGDAFLNCKKVVKIVEAINRNQPNVVPFAPYITDILALDNKKKEDKKRGMKNNFELLKRGFIDELWVFGDEVSAGMKKEMDLAKEQDIPVKIKE